jgi:hypothetical protein
MTCSSYMHWATSEQKSHSLMAVQVWNLYAFIFSCSLVRYATQSIMNVWQVTVCTLSFNRLLMNIVHMPWPAEQNTLAFCEFCHFGLCRVATVYSQEESCPQELKRLVLLQCFPFQGSLSYCKMNE